MAVQFTPGTFYRSLSTTLIVHPDVEDYPVAVPLSVGSVVLCEDIVFRKGGRGRGYYAKLLSYRGEDHPRVVCYHRVSKNRIGSGSWEVLNEMEVLAMASVLPLG